MIVIDPKHLSDVDFNLYGVTAVPRSHGDGDRQGYTEMGRPDHGICLVTSGCVTYVDGEGKSVTAESGDVIYVPRGKRYEVLFERKDESNAEDVLINFKISDALGREISLSDDILRLAEGGDPQVRQLFFAIASQCAGAGSVASVKVLLFDLMDRLLSAASGEGGVFSMEDCVSYINANYARIGEVSELAEMCGLGETAFRRRFREHVGMSPVHYINAVKVERACRMLLSGEVTTAEVSERLGFYDVAYFHKTFKRYVGKTPGEYIGDHRADRSRAKR